MDTAGTTLLKFLPAVYSAKSDGTDPAAAILSIWQDVYVRLEDARNAMAEALDPERAPEADGRNFLSWLGSWLALDAADEIFVDDAGGRDLPRFRRAVAHAAQVYPPRGTVPGLRKLAMLLLDEPIEILEWSWPEGLVVERSSTIGVDTFLADGPDHGARFTVTCRKTEFDADDEGPVELLEGALTGASRRKVLTGIASGAESAAAPDRLRLRRLRRLLDLEKPAHTECYLAFASATAEPAAVRREPMVIEVTSVIGACWIEAAN